MELLICAHMILHIALLPHYCHYTDTLSKEHKAHRWLDRLRSVEHSRGLQWRCSCRMRGATKKIHKNSSSSTSTSIKTDFWGEVWCTGGLGCLSTSRQEESTSAITSEEELLLLINLERVIRPSPNNFKFNILQHEGPFTNGEHSGQMSSFWAVGVPVNSDQGRPFNAQKFMKLDSDPSTPSKWHLNG